MIRTKFIEKFNEQTAIAIELAALEHGNEINDKNKGTDRFKWALLIAIGYQCMEVDKYRNYHNIKPPWIELKNWVKNNAELDSHDGDCDYIALLAGTYNEYINAKEID